MLDKSTNSILSEYVIKNELIHSSHFVEKYTGSAKTIYSFGDEWLKFNHNSLDYSETAASEYFDIFTLNQLKKDWTVIDVGCGTGRWARRIAPKVRTLYGIEPSSAINTFIQNTKDNSNIIPIKAFAERLPFIDSSIDLALSYGVLHHIVDTEKAIKEINRVLKEKGVFLFYFYYNLDNRSYFYKLIFNISNLMRRIISKFPNPIKNLTCEILTIFIYLPLVLFTNTIIKFFGSKLAMKVPLSSYYNKPFYILRNDCRDRFGTPLEKRYSKEEIKQLLNKNNFSEVFFSNNVPYWHGYAIK